MFRSILTLAAVSVMAVSLCHPSTSPPDPPGDQEYVSFTAGNGLTSQYHVYAAGVPEPAGLLIWTHGDGAYEFTHPRTPYVMGGPHGVKALANAQGYIVVSALAPDTVGTVTWWENGAANADYMADLITHLTAEYDIDTTDVVLAGFSGGAQFTTQYFLPAHSQMLSGGGSIVFGGGGAPIPSQQQPWNNSLKSTFFMHWATGLLDTAENSPENYDALGYAQAGAAAYDAAGFDTSVNWIPGEGHALDGMFGDIVAAQLWAHNPRGGTGPIPAGTPEAPQTDGSDWAVAIEPSRDRTYITVNVPAGVTSTTRVYTTGPGGYWLANREGSGEHTVQMGDPGTPYYDPLTPGSTYTYTVYSVTYASDGSEQLTQRATGTFTTLP